MEQRSLLDAYPDVSGCQPNTMPNNVNNKAKHAKEKNALKNKNNLQTRANMLGLTYELKHTKTREQKHEQK